MASSVNNSSINGFPPAISLSSVLLSSSHTTSLAAKIFGEDSGYPTGLRLNAALSDNDSGRFSLVSGLTVGSSAAAIAEAEANRIQELLTKVTERVGTIASDDIDEIERSRQREILKDDLKEIEQAIKDAALGDFNLLSTTHSLGVKLNITSGAFDNIGTTRTQTGSDADQTFKFKPNEISFETVDLDAALDDLRSLEVLTSPGGQESINLTNTTDTLARFQNVLNQSKDAINNFKRTLTQTAIENITVSGDPSMGDIQSGFEARQMASRLAQQLSQDSFNITANPTAKYFTLFT